MVNGVKSSPEAEKEVDFSSELRTKSVIIPVLLLTGFTFEQHILD